MDIKRDDFSESECEGCETDKENKNKKHSRYKKEDRRSKDDIGIKDSTSNENDRDEKSFQDGIGNESYKCEKASREEILHESVKDIEEFEEENLYENAKDKKVCNGGISHRIHKNKEAFKDGTFNNKYRYDKNFEENLNENAKDKKSFQDKTLNEDYRYNDETIDKKSSEITQDVKGSKNKTKKDEIKIEISRKVFNEAYLPFLNNEERLIIFYGGAGSGKSVFVVQRYIYKILSKKLCNVLVVRKTGNTNRTSTFALFKQIINSWEMNKYFLINKSDMSITCLLNKNQIIFKGLDDVEKIKSTTFETGELSDIWIEEASEVEEEDYKQLNVRLRGGNTKKQIVMTLNPININHWIKLRLLDRGKAAYLHTTYKDNRFIDEDYKRELESYKYTDKYYYDVYCLGMWGVSGRSVFDTEKITSQLLKKIKPIKEGYFDYDYDGIEITNIRWVEEKRGYIRIYEDVKEGYPYVIGGDTAGEGSDSFTAQVINNVTGKECAVLRHDYDEDLYIRQIYCLGKYFNDALISVEANYSTYPNKELSRLKYPKLYIRKREDTYTKGLTKSYGFMTTKLTRPVIISELIKIVKEESGKIVDKETLEEMLNFVRNEKGRAEAMAGTHDDLVMALAIAYHTRDQQEMTVRIKKTPRHYNFEAEKPKKDMDYGMEIKIV
ncbi:PBSX family phage terminase large subunit [uncultured Anaerofustis sp.]|uniref:PBSX family phage terminase large subunit n=1 Tax=uncultured Anaerofustis sp. TaxID=904996 RepID=UPI0025DB452F|nr:PBSX family phage terminase large subunit [uncultured Anaerofustis sp.]